MARILIVDDEENIRSSLKAALERRGHDVVTAETLARGAEYATAGHDVIFLDIMLPDGNGLDLLKTILGRDPKQAVVMISAHGDIDTAVDAIREGAYDFIEKPLSLDRVIVTVDNAVRAGALVEEKDRLAGIVYGDFVGESASIRELKDNVARSAPMTTRFLILGENGSGKELIANLVHRCGKYASGPFVAVNCAALPAELVEAELFGHTAGAFTGAAKARKGRFQEANGGSIFLDEISEMPLDAQAKILRAVETMVVSPVGSDKSFPVACNIIAASNRDLEKRVEENKFRQDLLYRLNVVQYRIPPLRERSDDIPLLAEYFLRRFADETKSPVKTLTEDALDALCRYAFPGNTRELKNLMERVNIYCRDRYVELDELQTLLPQLLTSQTSGAAKLPLSESVAAYERDCIRAALTRNRGNVSRTARELGLERSHLYKKMKKLGLKASSR